MGRILGPGTKRAPKRYNSLNTDPKARSVCFDAGGGTTTTNCVTSGGDTAVCCPESNKRKSWWLSGERPLQTMHYESKNGTWRVFGLVIGQLRHLEPSLSHS